MSQLTNEYPELKEKFNPAVLSFIKQRRIALNWRGIFLCVFWGLLLNVIGAKPDVSVGITLAVTVVMIYYLFFSDYIMFWFHARSKKGFTLFLMSDFLISLGVLAIFVITFFGIARELIVGLNIGPAQGAQAMVIFILMGLLWYAWPRDQPALRRPSMMMYRLLVSPWSLLQWFKFSWFSLVWLVVLYIICYKTMFEILAFYTEFFKVG
ncbi:hypothetical protein P2E05_00315 [Providencia stuartii]|uniref:hypothetical protein n=1 Tax=Providencia stuartii TaxID=588 RepID=UPI0023E2A701|nr:hypothetical protein [Providencia stuartii]ELR5143885.1 hypothetical protein [Providencia stuartii]WER22342.1 hypothetical protein P2E04_00315 [Providencia stuartii]WER26462.1 hypothetical protein P2E05_00315 [Providencia stuartii]WER30552.1 hypothetical protein P2E06_00315 [Providencia stuartii]